MKSIEVYTCKKHADSTKETHKMILNALQKTSHDSALSTQRHSIP